MTSSRLYRTVGAKSMPNKHAAIKDLRKNERRAARNLRMKIHVKALAKQLKELVKAGNKKEAMEISSKLQQAADKAGKNHVFHVNKTRRIVSASAKQLASAK